MVVRGTLRTWQDQIRLEFKNNRRALFGSLFSCGFLVFMIGPLAEVVNQTMPLPIKVLEIADLVLYALSYPVGFLLVLVKSVRTNQIFVTIVLLLGAIAVLTTGGADSIWLLIYAVVVSAMLLPRPAGMIVSVSLAVAAFGYSLFQPGGPNWLAGAVLLLMAVGMSGFARLGRDLSHANQEVARLAVAEERARVARDIHDVLGHSLTTVTLKLGLIRRLLETNPEQVARVLVEVAEAERLSRQAMSEVRATLSGYRSTSLTAEVAGARAVLESMRIEADLPRAVDDVDPAYQETFAYILREAVTNVLKHSNASRCQVRLGESWLEITDNGQPQGEAAASSRLNGGGTGLAGLADRMAALGGRLEAGPMADGGFRVWAGVPKESPALNATPTVVAVTS